MFAVGGRLGGHDRLIVREKLQAMVRSPWEWWMRAYSFPVPVAQCPSSLRRFDAPDVEQTRLPVDNLDAWLTFLMARSQYREAWALLCLVYLGGRRIPGISFVQWEGFPHRSKCWWFDEDRSALLPIPPGGAIARLVGLWYALNGGPYARGVIRPAFGKLLATWTSLSGPYYQSVLEEFTAEAAWGRLTQTFEDLRGVQHATVDSTRVPPPGAEVRGGVAYLDGQPLMRASVAADGDSFGPWGVDWLKSLEGLPPDILRDALELRGHGRGRDARRRMPRARSEQILTGGSGE